jgi:diketogulonate reductase-like aldo/keto reductase
MDIPRKKLPSGFSLPVLCMGTWMIGGALSREIGCDEDAAIESLRRGLNSGLTCIDTAEMYAAGYTEALVGRAIQGFEREALQIISKVSPHNLQYDDVLRAVEASLTRLGVDFLDVYLVHKPNQKIPLRETMRAMRVLKEQGLIRAVGVSNFSVASLCNAQDFLGGEIVLNQVHYNLVFREPEFSGLLDYCQKNNIFLMAWRPLEKGALLAGRPLVLENMCSKYHKSPAQVAINWLVSQKQVVTLSTMRSERNIQDNLGAVGWQLETKDIEALRAQFPNQEKVSNREPLK